MAQLHIYCRRCRTEVPSNAADPTGLCVICLTSDAVASDKAEYQRVWARYMRYKANPRIRSLVKLEKQLTGIARRLGDKVHARIPSPQHAIAIINAHLEEARNTVERGAARPRIILPTTGDMLAKNNPRGLGQLLGA